MKTDELIARIRAVVHCIAPPARELLEQAADRLEQLNAGGWIPVTERLPERGTPVLICVRICGDVFARVGWLHESGMWSVTPSRKWNYNSVTHWMPLPEPPKEEA